MSAVVPVPVYGDDWEGPKDEQGRPKNIKLRGVQVGKTYFSTSLHRLPEKEEIIGHDLCRRCDEYCIPVKANASGRPRVYCDSCRAEMARKRQRDRYRDTHTVERQPDGVVFLYR